MGLYTSFAKLLKMKLKQFDPKQLFLIHYLYLILKKKTERIIAIMINDIKKEN